MKKARNEATTVKDKGFGDILIFSDNGGPFHTLTGSETREWQDSTGTNFGKSFETVCIENGVDPVKNLVKG